jgi:hypothetical protein
MKSMDVLRELEFSQEWINLKIITPAKLKELEAKWASDEDTSTEHYRWGAFLGFVESKESVDEDTARALYSLGANDPAAVMGGSIMAHVVRRKEYPKDLLESAVKSEERFLRKIANERLAAEDERSGAI